MLRAFVHKSRFSGRDAVLAPGDQRDRDRADRARDDRDRGGLADTCVETEPTAQGDGAGASAHYTPDFMVAYLAYMAEHVLGLPRSF